MRGQPEIDIFPTASVAPMEPFVLETTVDSDGTMPDGSPEELEQRVIAALRTVYDPEIPLNIYDLGLVYHLDADTGGRVSVSMTLTAPGCPVAGDLVKEVHARLLGLSGVTRVRTELVWDPPWTRARMSQAALLELGLL